MADPQLQTVMAQAHQALMNDQTPQAQRARDYLKARGIERRSATKFKLGTDEGRIAIPYLNPDGLPRFIRYRRLEGDPKYQTPFGQGVHLYNVAQTVKPQVWLTEGEFDALCLDQLGLPAVGVAGVNGFKREWRFLFAHAERLTICFDPDSPGEEAAERVAGMIGSLVNDVRIINLPQGMDVSDWYVHDKDKLRGMVK